MFESMARVIARRHGAVRAAAATCGRPAIFAAPSSTEIVAEGSGPRCDVCNAKLDPKEDEHQGTGIYVWARGGDVRREIVLIARPSGAPDLTGSDGPTATVTAYHANRRERCPANSASKQI